MIDSAEVRRRARVLRVQLVRVEADYVLNHVLASIADYLPTLIFRGGTALARVWWPDFRLSEDLDFIGGPNGDDLASGLHRAIDQAGKRMGRKLELRVGAVRTGWIRSIVRSDHADLIIDVNVNERSFLPVEERELTLPYSDLSEPPRRISVVPLAEVLGNKWFMLDDRDEPRDLYDLWAGLVHFGVSLDDVARGHVAKYGFTLVRECLQSGSRLSALWEDRLRHQLADLPPFDQAFSDVQDVFDAWVARHIRA